MSWGVTMRLNTKQLKIIHQQVRELLGDSVRIWLFGSRINDNARGGDIDLYLETDKPLANRASTAARLAGKLQRTLGDQHIDIILADPNTQPQPIHQIVRQEGIRL